MNYRFPLFGIGLAIFLFATANGGYVIFEWLELSPPFWGQLFIWLGAPFIFASKDYSDVQADKTLKHRGFWISYFLPYLAAVFALAFFFAGLFDLLGKLVELLLEFITNAPRDSQLVALTIIGITSFFSWITFKFRKHFRLCYGAIEATLGLTIATQKLNATHYAYELLTVVLVSGIYLVVRGLDNMAQGIKTDRFLDLLRKNLPKLAKPVEAILNSLL